MHSVRNFAVPAGGTDVEVPVAADWGPGAYVAVHVFRTAADARSRPGRAIGLTWVGIDPGVRTLRRVRRRRQISAAGARRIRCGPRPAPGFAGKVGAGQLGEISAVDERVDLRLAVERRAGHLQIDPRGNQPGTGRKRPAGLAQPDERGQRDAAAGAVAADRDSAGIHAVFKQELIGSECIVERRRKRIFGAEPDSRPQASVRIPAARPRSSGNHPRKMALEPTPSR